jgi:PPP family 3-phenylpropionic acid transporter
MPLTLRLGCFYAAVFIGTGASLPYFPVWFRAQGLSGAEIGIILAAPMMARIFAGPLLAIWADGFRLRRTPLMLMALGSAAGYGALGLLQGFWPWLIAWVIATCLLTTVLPLGDVLGMRLARREGFVYALPRGLGSVAFIIGNISVGALLTLFRPELVLFWTVGAALLAALAAGVLLPPEPVHDGHEASPRPPRWRGLSELMTNRLFLLAVAGSGLIQATHAFYYGFSALIWRKEGIAEGTIGLLWATGVVAETAFMWFCEPWRRRWGPERMILLGGVAAIVRWTAFAFSPPLWMLFPLQALHGLSFTATFFGALSLIDRHAPPHTASAAQTISSALSSGLFIGLATLASGALYDRFHAVGYLGMSLMAAGGLMVALTLLRPENRNAAPLR